MRSKLVLAAATVFLLLSSVQSAVYAQGRRSMRDRDNVNRSFRDGERFRGRRIIVAPAYGFGWGYRPLWGWGDPWWGNPWYGYGYGYPVQIEHINYGTVKFKVKPESTRVYIDQKFVGTVDDLDNEKAYLGGGQHHIRLVAPNGQTFERTVFVAVGQKITIDERFGLAH